MIDFDVMTNLLDNDEEIVFAVLSAYQEDHADCVEEIRQAVATENWPQLHHLVHTLKGILASLGEEKAVPILEQIEQAAMKSTPPEDSLINTILEEMSFINKQIGDAVESYANAF